MTNKKVTRREFLKATTKTTAKIAIGAVGLTALAQTMNPLTSSLAAPSNLAYGVIAFPFALNEVTLQSSRFLDNRNRALSYLSFLDSERMLHTFRLNYGLTSSATAAGGWEATNMGLRGHSMGHFLTALAQAYKGTNDAQYKTKADYLITELKKCYDRATTVGFTAGYLSAFPESHVNNLLNVTGAGQNTCWAPLYTIHKIITGIFDCYELLGNATALTMATGMANWIYAKLSPKTAAQRQSMWNYMAWNAGEYGGFNETLARIYNVTGTANHLTAARFFDHDALFTPCTNNQDQLNGMHANTQIPKIIGALKIHEVTNITSYYTLANNFWYMVAYPAHAYANRGNSRAEYFKAPNAIASQLGDDNTETCNTYNMLKLSRQLFFHDPTRTTYMDFYELALYNHILGTQNPSASHGFSSYFTPLRAGGIRTYSDDYSTFTCCHSTGLMESGTKFQDSIYFYAGETLYVNLFIPSTLTWTSRGITVTQTTSFPAANTTQLTIGGSGHIALKIRCPYWVQPGWQLKINGVVQSVTGTPDSYVTVDRTWANGDVIDITMPMSLRFEATPDNASVKALFYGPILLGGAFGTTDLGSVNPNLDASTVVSSGTLRWTAIVNGTTRTLMPFYELHGQRYAVYWVPSGTLPSGGPTPTPTRTNTPGGPTPTPTRTPTPGGTFPVPGTYYRLINRNSGKVADVSGASTADGGDIVQWTSNGGANQQWSFVSVGGGYYKIVNRNSGKLVDVSGASTADGADVVQWTDNGGMNQQWSLVSMGSGYYKIVNRNSGKLFDVLNASTADGANIHQWADVGVLAQQWQIIP
jgi:DUF1680 family protein